MSRMQVTINNRFLFSSTDNTVVNPEDSVLMDFLDTTNTALIKGKAIVPELPFGITNWKQGNPVRLVNLLNLGMTAAGQVNYTVFTPTMPLYAFLGNPNFPVAPAALAAFPASPAPLGPVISDITLLISERIAALAAISAGRSLEGSTPGDQVIGSSDILLAVVTTYAGVVNTDSQATVNAATLAIYNAMNVYALDKVPAALAAFPSRISPSVSDITLLTAQRGLATSDAATGLSLEGLLPGDVIMTSTAALTGVIADAAIVDDTFSQMIVNSATQSIYDARVFYAKQIVPPTYGPEPTAPNPIGSVLSDITLLTTEIVAASATMLAKGIAYEGIQPGQLIVGSTAILAAAIAAAQVPDDTYPQLVINDATLAIYNAKVAYIFSVVPAPYFTIDRLYVLDGGLTDLWAINPAIFNNGVGDSEVKTVFGYVI